jgi:hypothetical protein
MGCLRLNALQASSGRRLRLRGPGGSSRVEGAGRRPTPAAASKESCGLCVPVHGGVICQALTWFATRLVVKFVVPLLMSAAMDSRPGWGNEQRAGAPDRDGRYAPGIRPEP